MNANLNDYKERVKRLRKAVSSVLNIECTQSQAYELIAKEENYPNWDALSGSIDKNHTEVSALNNKEQITQLFLIHAGLKSGQTFNSILYFLKEQNNPIFKKVWSNVKISKDTNAIVALVQTNFFSEDVLSILKISAQNDYLERSIESAIEYLKII